MRYFLFVFAVSVITTLLPSATPAQSRDYLTDQEIEIVRDAQQIDDRIAVLAHAIDRRLTALGSPAGSVAKEKADMWGPRTTGTRLQLLNDIKLILQKASDDIDNLADRPDSMVIDPELEKDKKKPKGFSDLFPKAVRALADAANRFEPVLKAQLDATKDEMEKGVILAAIENCDEIIASVAKLPAALQKAKH